MSHIPLIRHTNDWTGERAIVVLSPIQGKFLPRKRNRHFRHSMRKDTCLVSSFFPKRSCLNGQIVTIRVDWYKRAAAQLCTRVSRPPRVHSNVFWRRRKNQRWFHQVTNEKRLYLHVCVLEGFHVHYICWFLSLAKPSLRCCGNNLKAQWMQEFTSPLKPKNKKGLIEPNISKTISIIYLHQKYLLQWSNCPCLLYYCSQRAQVVLTTMHL